MEISSVVERSLLFAELAKTPPIQLLGSMVQGVISVAKRIFAYLAAVILSCIASMAWLAQRVGVSKKSSPPPAPIVETLFQPNSAAVCALTETLNRVVQRMAPTICDEETKQSMERFKELLRQEGYPYQEELEQNVNLLTELSRSGFFASRLPLQHGPERFFFNPELFELDGGRFWNSSLLIKDGNRHHHTVPYPGGTESSQTALESMRRFLSRAASSDGPLEELFQLMVTQEVMAQYCGMWVGHMNDHHLHHYFERITFNSGREIVLDLRRDERGVIRSIRFFITMKGCIRKPLEGGGSNSGLLIPLALKARGTIRLDRVHRMVMMHNKRIHISVS